MNKWQVCVLNMGTCDMESEGYQDSQGFQSNINYIHVKIHGVKWEFLKLASDYINLKNIGKKIIVIPKTHHITTTKL